MIIFTLLATMEMLLVGWLVGVLWSSDRRTQIPTRNASTNLFEVTPT